MDGCNKKVNELRESEWKCGNIVGNGGEMLKCVRQK